MAWSTFIASRSVRRLTPVIATSSGSGGSRDPGS